MKSLMLIVASFCSCAVVLTGGCASAPLDFPRTESFAFMSPQETALGRNFHPQTSAHPGETGVYLLPGGPDALVARAELWLESDDRELCFGAAALTIEVLGDARVLATLRESELLLAYLSHAVEKVAKAPRAAERSEGRRRVLTSLAVSLPKVIATLRSGERGLRWFEEACAAASHPDVRKAFSQALVRLSNSPHALGSNVIDKVREVFEGSAKPLRDPTLVRPGTGRGRRSRNHR